MCLFFSSSGKSSIIKNYLAFEFETFYTKHNLLKLDLKEMVSLGIIIMPSDIEAVQIHCNYELG